MSILTIYNQKYNVMHAVFCKMVKRDLISKECALFLEKRFAKPQFKKS